MKFTSTLILLILFCLPSLVCAELPEQVRADFEVIDGYVVMPIDDKYIIDLDARNGLRVGDILTSVKSGRKILHPVTQEVVGSVEEVVGFLQVTRVLSGYSYAKSLDAELNLAGGALVKRFEQVPAYLEDTTGEGSEVIGQVKAFLPQFEWLPTSESERALLTFTHKGDFLNVRNAQGDSLHKYKVTAEQELASSDKTSLQPAVTSEAKPKKKPLQQLADSVVGVFTETTEERFAEIDEAIIRQKQSSLQGIWMGPNLVGSATGLTVADLNGDGRLETATVLDNKIVIAQISAGEFNQLTEFSIPIRLKVLSIDSIDLDGDGQSELYLTAMNGNDLSSIVVECKSDNCEIVVRNVGWYLRVVDLPGHEEKVLVGQDKGGARAPYFGSVFEVSREGDQLVRGNDVDLPKPLNLFSFAPFAAGENVTSYAHLSAGDYLKVVSQDGVDMWESADYYGGSEIWFYPRAEAKDEMLAPERMKARIIKASSNEILVIQNDGQRLTQNYRKFKNSRVVSLAWNGFSLVEQWRTSSQRGYLADFALADADNDGADELVMAIKFKHKGLIDSARSAVVIYELE